MFYVSSTTPEQEKQCAMNIAVLGPLLARDQIKFTP